VRPPATRASRTGRPVPSPMATLAASVAAMPGQGANAPAPEPLSSGAPSPASRHHVSRPARLTMRPHEIVGVSIGRNRSNRRDADHGKCG